MTMTTSSAAAVAFLRRGTPSSPRARGRGSLRRISAAGGVPGGSDRTSGTTTTTTTRRCIHEHKRRMVDAAEDRRSKNAQPGRDGGFRTAYVNGSLDLGSYLASFRLRTVDALASTLTNTEKDALLSRLGAVSEETAEQSARHSIGEAVATAVAKEAERNSRRWERERESILERAEAAALERVRGELAVRERQAALDRWREDVAAEEAAEKEEEENVATDNAAAAPDSSRVNGSSVVEDPLMEEAHHHHPILGPALCDLGYKRIHVASARSLASVPIWERQRAYRHERAKAMANDKMKTMGLGLPGIISLHEAKDGQLSIIDGQHRLGMMTILERRLEAIKADSHGDNVGTAFDFDRILVEVFPQKADDNTKSSSASSHAEDIFTEINKAEPVKLVDMPGVARGNDRRVINDAAAKLQESYGDMFKPSQRCRPPHVNVDNLRDALFAADVLKRQSIKTSKDLLQWILLKNDELAMQFGDADGTDVKVEGAKDPPARGVSKTALAKARKYNFFLGLDSSWLYN